MEVPLNETQMRILRYLRDHHQKISINFLVERIMPDHQATIVNALLGLSDRGLIKWSTAADKITREVAITELGISVFETLVKVDG